MSAHCHDMHARFLGEENRRRERREREEREKRGEGERGGKTIAVHSFPSSALRTSRELLGHRAAAVLGPFHGRLTIFDSSSRQRATRNLLAYCVQYSRHPRTALEGEYEKVEECSVVSVSQVLVWKYEVELPWKFHFHVLTSPSDLRSEPPRPGNG